MSEEGRFWEVVMELGRFFLGGKVSVLFLFVFLGIGYVCGIGFWGEVGSFG